MHAPLSDSGGFPPTGHSAGRTVAFHSLDAVGFGSGFPDLSVDHHYTFFGAQSRGLRPRLPSASDTASQRSPFGSAIDLLAKLGSSGILHPLGNVNEFYEVSPRFHRSGFISARPAAWFAIAILLLV